MIEREDREKDIESLHHCAVSGFPDGTMAEGVVDKNRACRQINSDQYDRHLQKTDQ